MSIDGKTLPLDVALASEGLTLEQSRTLHREHSDVLHAAAMSKVRITSAFGSAANNLSALQDAVAAAIDESYDYPFGQAIDVAAGEYELADTLEIREAWGVRLVGRGERTKFVWTGSDDTKPVFRFAHARSCGLERMQIHAVNAAYAAVQTLRDNAEGWQTTPKDNVFRDVFLRCDGKAKYGVVVGGANSVDVNNDFHFFENVICSAYTEAAFYMANHMQSYNNTLLNCQMLANGHGKYGIQAATGDGSTSASFLMRGGGMFGHSVADFYLGRSYQPFLIEGVNSEGSARLLLLASTNGFRNVVIRGCRWSSGGLHEDGKVILNEGGTLFLNLETCTIGDGRSPTGAMTFDFGTENVWRKVVMNLCSVISSSETLWNGIAPVNIADGTNIQVTDEVNLVAQDIVA